MMMRIERVTTDALDSAVALLGAQFNEHRIAISLASLRDAVGGLVSGEGRGAVLVASDPNPLGVAALAYTWTLEHGGLVAWLDELYVLPEHRGRGVGRALLLRALDVANENGCHAVDLEVDAHHARAEHLYEREGFTTLSRRRWAKKIL